MGVSKVTVSPTARRDWSEEVRACPENTGLGAHDTVAKL